MKTISYPRWRKHNHSHSELYYVHPNSWLYEVHEWQGVVSAHAPERYGGDLGKFPTVESAKAACEQNYAIAKAKEDAQNPFFQIKRILYPWLGDFLCHGLGSQPDDIFCYLSEIKSHGFTRLTFQNRNANPHWIKPKWRTYTETKCPRCQQRIMALLKTHRISYNTATSAPFIFCDCIRLQPSKLPSLSFFTDNWYVVLEALDFMVAYHGLKSPLVRSQFPQS